MRVSVRSPDGVVSRWVVRLMHTVEASVRPED